MDGSEAFLATLREAGVQYIFGIPGTTEVALMDSLADQEEIQYVLTLHESIAVGMADGFARATGEPGVVSVHATVGTANTLGMLINSFTDKIPVVVTAGIKDNRSLGTGVFCDSPSQVSDLLRQYTKWSWQVLEPTLLGRDLAKALRQSLNPVPGPVFMGVPENFWSLPSQADLESVKHIPRQFRGDYPSIQKAIGLLESAVYPVMMVGNEVGRAGALAEVIAFAEYWRIPVFNEEQTSLTNLNFPTDHSLYMGCFNHNSPLIKKADVVISVGASMFMPMSYQINRYFSPETQIIQIHSDPAKIATHVRVELGIISEARMALLDLLEASEKISLNLNHRKNQLEEITKLKSLKAQTQQDLLAVAKDTETIKVQLLINELSSQASKDAIVVNEGIRSGFYLQDYFDFTRARSYYGYTGGCLGWGLPAAMGVKLAYPEREVIAFLGDGSFLFSPQALWTAAHYGISIKIVICNNRAYMAVKGSLKQHNGRAAASGKFVGVDLTKPEINYSSLCQGFGISAWKATSSIELTEKMNQFLSHKGPAVLEVILDPSDMEKRPE